MSVLVKGQTKLHKHGFKFQDGCKYYIAKCGSKLYWKNSSTQQYEHIEVAEKQYGGPLPEGAEVHHLDEDGLNNDPLNLEICLNKFEHKQEHRRADALEACGHADWLVCIYCGNYDDPVNMTVWKRKDRGGSLRARHPACYRAYMNEWNRANKEGVNTGRRSNYDKNKEEINAKRRAAYAAKKAK